MTLSLRSARTSFETAGSVVSAVNENGFLIITAGQMAKQNLPDQATYKEIAKALGEDAPLFRFRPRTDGSKFPSSTTLAVFSDSADGHGKPRVYNVNLEPVEATFVRYKLGYGGFAIVKIGKAEVEVEIPVPTELKDAIRALDEGDNPIFDEIEGEPPFVALINEYTESQVLRPVPQRDIPPHAQEVPLLTDLEVTKILPDSRAYNTPRIEVVRKDTGEVISGLIATAPICRAIGVRDGESFKLEESSIGKSFQILELVVNKDRDGNPIPVLDRFKKPVLDDEGNPRYQVSVIVRETTNGGVELDLSL